MEARVRHWVASLSVFISLYLSVLRQGFTIFLVNMEFCVDQVGFKLRYPSASASGVLGVHHHAWLNFFLFIILFVNV